MPTEQARVGERALQGVVLGGECQAELLDRRVQHLEPAGVERRERGLALDDVERRALPRARLGELQRSGRELEGRERGLCPRS